MNLLFFYKTAGVLSITMSCVMASISYARGVRMTLDAARDAERFVRYVGDAIRYRSDNIADIIGSYYTDCTPMRPLWERASASALSDAIPDFPFDETTRRIMSEFASELGRSYRDTHLPARRGSRRRKTVCRSGTGSV